MIQADNAPTCGVAEWVHSLAAQLSQAPQLAAYHQILSTDHELRYHLKCSSHRLNMEVDLQSLFGLQVT